MRQLDVFQTYFDNTGIPLNGRIRFKNPDNSPANVYGLDGITSLGTEILTDSNGRTQYPIVMLDNHDYRIYFDKLVDEYAEVVDDRYENIGNGYNVYPAVPSVVDSTVMRTIDTINDLRNYHPTTPTSSQNIVLLGYESKGDKHPVMYWWDSTSTASDNGGSIIKPESVASGRWIMTPPSQYLDVADFGAFGVLSIQPQQLQRQKIGLANEYARQNNLTLYFGTSGMYDISGLTLKSIKGSTNRHVGLFSLGTAITVVEDCDENMMFQHTTTGTLSIINVYGERLRTSQDRSNGLKTNLHASRELIVDSTGWTPNFTGNVISDTTVSFEAILDCNCSIRRCNINSNGSIKPTGTNHIYMQDCEVGEYMFGINTNFANITFTNCRLKSWSTMDFLLSMNGSPEYDLEGKTITYPALPSGIYKNGIFNSSIGNMGADLKFVNCTINGSIHANSVECISCEVTGNIEMVQGIILTNSKCNGSVEALTTVTLTNSIVNNDIECAGITAINSNILLVSNFVGGEGSLTNCTIGVSEAHTAVPIVNGTNLTMTNVTCPLKIISKDFVANSCTLGIVETQRSSINDSALTRVHTKAIDNGSKSCKISNSTLTTIKNDNIALTYQLFDVVVTGNDSASSPLIDGLDIQQNTNSIVFNVKGGRTSYVTQNDAVCNWRQNQVFNGNVTINQTATIIQANIRAMNVSNNATINHAVITDSDVSREYCDSLWTKGIYKSVNSGESNRVYSDDRSGMILMDLVGNSSTNHRSRIRFVTNTNSDSINVCISFETTVLNDVDIMNQATIGSNKTAIFIANGSQQSGFHGIYPTWIKIGEV